MIPLGPGNTTENSEIHPKSPRRPNLVLLRRQKGSSSGAGGRSAARMWSLGLDRPGENREGAAGEEDRRRGTLGDG
jgi:hypothetical protein